MKIILIKREEFNENKYMKNALIMNSEKNNKQLFLNEGKLLGLLFNKWEAKGKEYRSLDSWIKSGVYSPKIYKQKLADFKVYINYELTKWWDKNAITKVIVCERLKSNLKEEKGVADEGKKPPKSIEEHYKLKKYLKEVIVENLGDSKSYKKFKYKNAKDFKDRLCNDGK